MAFFHILYRIVYYLTATFYDETKNTFNYNNIKIQPFIQFEARLSKHSGMIY